MRVTTAFNRMLAIEGATVSSVTMKVRLHSGWEWHRLSTGNESSGQPRPGVPGIRRLSVKLLWMSTGRELDSRSAFSASPLSACWVGVLVEPGQDFGPSIPDVLADPEPTRSVSAVAPLVDRGNGNRQVVRQILRRQQPLV